MVKRNNIKKEQASKKEAECLEFLRLLRHEHIIELLASYEYRDEHYLLFPFYPMDLEGFMSSEERFGDFSQNQTFYNALSGLASAVEAVHNLNVSVEGLLLSRIGYHHDIRPKNVLVTPRTFILTDFGLARLKVPDESSHTLWKNTVGDYIAPECMDEDFTHMDIGRSIDIWSFGCLVSEVATYMEEGQTGVKQFRAQRRTTVTHQMIQNGYFFENNRLRASADDWLIRLSTNPKDRGIRCLVECVRQMLQVEVDVRPRAALISSWLDYVNMKALYHSILELLQCLDLDPLQQNGLHSPYSRLDVWFEVEKLNAWGRVLGMHNDRPYQELFENDRRTAGIVRSILESFRVDLPPSQLESQGQGEDIETQARHTTILASIEATLRSKVKDLWEAVPLTYQKRMEQSWRQSSLDTEDLPMLTRIEDEARLMSSPFSDIGMHAALKRLELEFWREGERSSHEQKELLLQSWQIEQSSMLSSRHGVGNFTPKDSVGGSVDSTEKRVLLEWVIYSPIWQGQSDQEKIVKLLSLAEILHHSKPESFHVLDCLGVLPPDEEQQQRGFGFVYAFPSGKKHDPISLCSLLEQKHSMLLEDKFRIARCLAESISQLHTHGWLHKNIHTRNIIFFPNSKKLSSSTKLGQPYLIGFQHSRPDGEIWYSDMDPSAEVPTEHRDPRYNPGSNRFQRMFDYYSLGIVLLEVGFWEPIGQFRARHRNLSKTAFRDTLVQKYIPKLGFKMGTTYMEVVADCLRSSFGESAQSRDESEIEGGFFWTVVDKLSALKIR